MARTKTKAAKISRGLLDVLKQLIEVFEQYPIDELDSPIKQLPGALLVLAEPKTSTIEYHNFGFMEDDALTLPIGHLVKNMYSVRQLRAPPPAVTLIPTRETAGVGPAPPAESYLLRDQLRAAWVMVIEPEMRGQHRLSSNMALKMCHQGKWSRKDGVTAQQIAGWIPVDGTCPCGNSCSAARVALGYPGAPLVNVQVHNLRSDKARLVIEWAMARCPEFALKAEELRSEWEELRQRHQAAKAAAAAAGLQRRAAAGLSDDASGSEEVEEQVEARPQAVRRRRGAGGPEVGQEVLQATFQRFNTMLKADGAPALLAALKVQGFSLKKGALATALKAAGLGWGKPTPAQVEEALGSFKGNQEEHGKEYAVGAVAGMLGCEIETARTRLVKAGLLHRRKKAARTPTAPGADGEGAHSDSSGGAGEESGLSSSAVSSSSSSGDDVADDDSVDLEAPCAVCGSPDDSKYTMVFCDGCTGCYHVNCLTPPLVRVPPQGVPWFCPGCGGGAGGSRGHGATARGGPRGGPRGGNRGGPRGGPRSGPRSGSHDGPPGSAGAGGVAGGGVDERLGTAARTAATAAALRSAGGATSSGNAAVAAAAVAAVAAVDDGLPGGAGAGGVAGGGVDERLGAAARTAATAASLHRAGSLGGGGGGGRGGGATSSGNAAVAAAAVAAADDGLPGGAGAGGVAGGGVDERLGAAARTAATAASLHSSAGSGGSGAGGGGGSGGGATSSGNAATAVPHGRPGDAGVGGAAGGCVDAPPSNAEVAGAVDGSNKRKASAMVIGRQNKGAKMQAILDSLK